MSTDSLNRILPLPLALESKLRLFDLGILDEDAFTPKDLMELHMGIRPEWDFMEIYGDY